MLILKTGSSSDSRRAPVRLPRRHDCRNSQMPERRLAVADPSGVNHACLMKTPVGVEPTRELLGRQPSSRLAPAHYLFERPRQVSNLDLQILNIVINAVGPGIHNGDGGVGATVEQLGISAKPPGADHPNFVESAFSRGC